MKLHKVERYINGDVDIDMTDLVVRDQKQKITALEPEKEYPLEFAKEFLGLDAGESLIENEKEYYDSFYPCKLIEEGIDYGVLLPEAIVVKNFEYGKVGDTIYFREVPVCFSEPELNLFTEKELRGYRYDDGEGHSCWGEYVDCFVMRSAPTLAKRIEETLKERVKEFPDTRDPEKLRYHYLTVRQYLVRALKIANANGILLNLEWFDKQLDEIKPLIDFTKEWTILSLDPESVLTFSEALKVLMNGGSVKDEKGTIYTKDSNRFSMNYKYLYERN